MQPTAVLAEPPGGPLFAAADTSQADEALRRACEADVRRQVDQVAGHLRAVNPGDQITDTSRFATAALVAGTVGRMRPLLRVLPHVDTFPAGATRGEYADILTGR